MDTTSFYCNSTEKNAANCFEKTTTGLSRVSKDTYLERSLGFLVVGTIGIVSNLCVICVLGSSTKIRQKIVNTLIIHQSLVDFLSSLALVGTAHLDGSDSHGQSGIHARIYCFFVAPKWPLWSMMFTSSFSLIFLNIERYISIVYPMYHIGNVTRSKVIKLLPIVWLLGILEDSLIASAFVSDDGACGVGSSNYHTLISWITLVAYIVLHFFFPVILVVFLYGHMIVRLRRHHSGASARRNMAMEKAKNNVFKTMLLITLCYAVCYAFNCVYIALFLAGNLHTLSGQFYSFTVYMVCTNAIVNPFVYAIQYHEFQHRVRDIFRCKQLCQGEDATADATLENPEAVTNDTFI